MKTVSWVTGKTSSLLPWICSQRNIMALYRCVFIHKIILHKFQQVHFWRTWPNLCCKVIIIVVYVVYGADML